MNEKRKRILLVNLFSNGDCLYATTIARQIKIDYPDCHLTWAIAAFCKDIIDGNPDVDEVKEVNDISKNDIKAFRRFKKKVSFEKDEGIWDELFITQNMDENQALYDGCIRTNILRAYPHPITISNTPILKLKNSETNNAKIFVRKNNLENYNFRILFEFAPQSGQLSITKDYAIKLAETLIRNPAVIVILSSALQINHSNDRIVDGSVLTLRETAALTFFCTHMIGCSSGITWATTSDGAKMLPMIQLINPDTTWINPLSRDFKRFNKSVENIIDLIDFNIDTVAACIELCFWDFISAKEKYNQEIPLQFKTSSKIVYNLLCRLQFKAILKHITVNREVYGDNLKFYKEIFIAFMTFPFRLIRNILKKRIFYKKSAIS